MTGNDLQRLLDLEGFADVPRGQTSLDAPLFLDGDRALVGPGRQGCILDGWNSGTVLIAGWRRGMVGDEHFTPQGFRTWGKAYLFSRGTEFDLGPSVGGWGALASLRVEFAGTRNGPSWVYHEPNDAFETVLCGIQAAEGYAPLPSPWLLWFDNTNHLTLSLRFSDGSRADVVLPGDPAAVDLSADVSVDFQTGAVSGVVNGVAVAETIFPAGRRLAGNVDWPFQVARGDGQCNAAGYWGGKLNDVTVARVRVSSVPGDWAANTDFPSGRVPTYPGGASLPLARAWSSGGAKFLFAVNAAEQGVADSCGNTTVRGVALSTGNVNPLVSVGGSQGALRFEDVYAGGGTRFLQCTGLAVVYPLVLSDLRAQHQKDRQLWVYRSIMSIRDVDFGYGVRGAATFRETSGGLADVFVAPPGSPQDAVFDQRGGSVCYDRVVADYEYRPAPPVVRLTGDSEQGEPRATVARINDCEGGASPLFAVLPPRAGYTAACRIEVDRVPVSIVSAA